MSWYPDSNVIHLMDPSNVSFKPCVSLLIFCFDYLSIGVSVLLVSYYYCVTVNLSFYVC